MKNLTKIRIYIIIACAITAYIFPTITKAGFTFDTLIPAINDVIYTGNVEKSVFENLVQTFCTADRYTKQDQVPNTEIIYNREKSLFMYTLCTDNNSLQKNFDEKEGFSTNKNKSYILFEKDKDGNEYNTLTQGLPDLYRETEDYIQELFDNIIASYVTIYQANIYGYTADTNKTDEDMINEFSQKYFPFGLDKSTPYIQICGNDKEYNYSKTCKKFKSYIASARNSIRSSKNILNTETIHQIYLGKQKKYICANKNKNYDMIACGLYTDLSNFTNLVYNELFFYTAFAEYYKFALTIQPNFKNNANQDRAIKAQKQQQRIDQINSNIQYSKDAIKLSLRMLKQGQLTFPLHIGFLMYAEGINSFSMEFNKTLTPIYTLYDLFRNVQIKE